MAQFVLNTDSPFRLGTLSSDPTSAENGTFYYNNSDNVIRLFTDSSWDALAGKSYVDSVSLDKAYLAGATINTTSDHGPVVIAGSEKLVVTASSGLDVQSGSSFLGGGLITNSSGMDLSITTTDASQSGPIIIKAGNLEVNPYFAGTIVLFGGDTLPTAASGTNAGNLLFNAGQGTATDCNGGSIQINAGLGLKDGGNLYLGAGGASIGNPGNVTISSGVGSTNNGDVILAAGNIQKLAVKGNGHVQLGIQSNQYIDYVYHHELAFSAGTTIINTLTFAHTQFGSVEISYHMKDQDIGGTRVGMLLVTCDGVSTSVADTFTETDNLGISWSAGVSGDNVQLTVNSSTEVKFNCLVKSHLKIDGPLLLGAGSELSIPAGGEVTIPSV